MFPSLVGPPGPPGSTVLYAANYAQARLLHMASAIAGTIVNVGGVVNVNDGGEGPFAYDPTSVEADNGGTVLAPIGPGRLIRINRTQVHAKWFGVIGQGGDDTAAIQAAINYCGDDYQLIVDPGVYRTSGLTLAVGTKLIAPNAEFRPTGNNVTIVTVPENPGGLQLGPSTSIDSPILNANGATGITGLDVQKNAYFNMVNVRVDGCLTGVRYYGAQFAMSFGLKAYNCGVAVYIKPAPAYGGGEANVFFASRIVNSDVGIISNKATSVYPTNNNAFIGGVFEGMVYTAVAAFGGEVNLTSIKTEANAQASAGLTYTYDGLTIKGAVLYASDSATINVVDVSTSDAQANPFSIIEDNSFLNLHNVRNYGAGGVYTNCSTTGKVTITGATSIQGVFEGLSDACGMTQAPFVNGSGALYLTPLSTIEDHGLPNETTATPQLGDYTGANGTISTGLDTDAKMGEVRKIHFDTIAGNGNVNISVWNITFAASGVTVVSFNMMVDQDGKFNFQIAPNINSWTATLRAGVYYRVVWMFTNVTAGAKDFIVQPADSVGAIAKFSRWNVLSGANTQNVWGLATRAVRGAYNPNIKTRKPYYEANAAPVAGVFEVGDVIWHSAPTSGGNIGWVCTTAPLTFKAFGTIA